MNPVCEIYEVHWCEKAPCIYFEIEADSFLRGMVRAVVGTMLIVNRKFLLASGDAEMELRRILEAKNRSAAGMSAPAHGLSLISVKYSE